MPASRTTKSLELAGLDVPVLEVTGARPGPSLTVIAGVHGCEYSSMAGLRSFVNGLDPERLAGRLTAVPVLNLPAFWTRTPFVVPEDGKNINRCFPGKSDGTLAERLADAAFRALIAPADALVDLHAGDQPEALEPFAIYDAGPREEDAKALALAFGARYAIRQEPGPDRAVGGTSSSAAAAAGIPAIIAEAGGCGLVTPDAVAQHRAGLARILAALGMLTEAVPPPEHETTLLGRFSWLYSHHAGWWAPIVEVGEAVQAGQVLGTISTIDGTEELEEIRADTAGVPIFITTSPAVLDEGLLLGLGAAATR
jgi:uncharacterized protein